MSSDKKGVQAEIMKFAPDADYQGCCLHRLNLVICHACKIISITNMMDTVRVLYSFCDNSPKRQNFLNTVVRALSSSKKTKIKSLCKTRWVERHKTFEKNSELYEYIVITLSEMCQPSDERFYQDIEDWGWDRNTKVMANGLVSTMKDFGHIISFVCAKQLLEPMRPVVTSLQGKLAEVYFGFKKIEEVIYIYEETREKADVRFHSVYAEAVSLAEKFGSEEKRTRLCGRQKNRENIPSETVKEYWQRSVYLPFLDGYCMCRDEISFQPRKESPL